MTYLDQLIVVGLVVLDLSAAFIQLILVLYYYRCMTLVYGTRLLPGLNPSWQTTTSIYIYIHTHIKGQRPHEHRLSYGVFRESLPGPIRFTFHTNPLGQISSANCLKLYLHTGDTQLCISFKQFSRLTELYVLNSLEKSVGDIKEWLTTE